MKTIAEQNISDPEERLNFYVNNLIDYFSERIESMINNAGDMEETLEVARLIEMQLDEIIASMK